MYLVGELFYRASPANEGLVFATTVDALTNHTMRTALQYSTTWGEFRRGLAHARLRGRSSTRTGRDLP
jgi:hypothetical protein